MIAKNLQFQWSVIGHEAQKGFIANAISKGRMAHAYLFTGPDKCGKTTFAADLVRILLCESETIRPCGSCFSCRTPSAAQAANSLVIDQHETISIEQIRMLQEKFATKPLHAPHQVALIAHADQLTDEASAALLKFLEEPSGSTIVVLTSSKPLALPLTIRSRVQQLRFGLSTDDDIQLLLKQYSLPIAAFKKLPLPLTRRLGEVKAACADHRLLKQYIEYAESLSKICTLPVHERLQRSAELAEGESEEIVRVLSMWVDLAAWKLREVSDYGQGLRLGRTLDRLLEALEGIKQSLNKRLTLDYCLLNMQNII